MSPYIKYTIPKILYLKQDILNHRIHIQIMKKN